MYAFLEIPNAGMIENDPFFALSNNIIKHLNKRSDELTRLTDEYNKAYRLLVAGLRESGLSTILYPDANSTLRLTYGKVSALPADKRNDAKSNYYTTLQGTINKYKPNDQEFDLPQRLIELNAKKDFGPYADKAGYMPVNFFFGIEFNEALWQIKLLVIWLVLIDRTLKCSVVVWFCIISFVSRQSTHFSVG